MKAVVYTRYGSPDVLQLREVAKPAPRDNEVLIRVRAAEVTKADCELRSFNFPVKWFWLPLRVAFGLLTPRRQVLGGYFSGEIESVGKEVSRFKPGDQIFGSTGLRMGAYGEYICLPASHTMVAKPNNMSFEEAAAVPLGGLNALHFLRKANIRNEEKVLVNGAGGSIGPLSADRRLVRDALGLLHVAAMDATSFHQLCVEPHAELAGGNRCHGPRSHRDRGRRDYFRNMRCLRG